MSASDTALMHNLIERLERLEYLTKDLGEQVAELVRAYKGKDMQAELYGTEQPDHTAEREARRGPGRPPGR